MNELLESLNHIQEEFTQALLTEQSVDDIKRTFLAKKGALAAVFDALAGLNKEDKIVVGQAANQLRARIQHTENTISVQTTSTSSSLDISVPALPETLGTIHPISAMIERMVTIFNDMSFEVVEGPEIVSDKENFEVLNIDKDHPARDSQESFFIDDTYLLRTQTTAVQVLEMNRRYKRGDLPIRLVVPGKVYRKEATDATHSCMFHQIDAVMVDNQTTFSDLKGCLDYFAKRLFGNNVETRFRPHHFPFTEPSAELDIRWKNASGKGKHTEWLEMGGCGMIHPEVLKRAGINPKIYQGWAFGMSIERPIMVENHLPDLRLLFNNSAEFLSQFRSTL